MNFSSTMKMFKIPVVLQRASQNCCVLFQWGQLPEKNTTIRKANLIGYNNTIVNYQPSKSYTPTQTYQSRRYNNSNYESPRYNTRSTDNDSRNYTPSSSGSSGSSSGSSAPSGTPVARPGRGG